MTVSLKDVVDLANKELTPLVYEIIVDGQEVRRQCPLRPSP